MANDPRIPARVVYFSDAGWVGGAERYLYLLATNLERTEFEPSVVVNGAARLEGLAAPLERAGVPVHAASLNLPYSPAGIVGFISLLRRLRPSILHCNLPGPWDSQYSLVAPLARIAGVRHVVSTEHLPMVPPFAKGRLFKSLGTLSIERIITVSDDNVRYLTGSHHIRRDKIRVVRIGTPEPLRGTSADIRRELHCAAGDFLCAMVGSLEERKGHGTAFEALRATDVGVKLLVVGSGEREGEYRAKAAALGLAERVHFLGYRTDVDDLLRECDVLLCPSTLEATPYVVLEAMAASLPVIASRLYGIPEIVLDGTTGILFDPPSGRDLAAAIDSLFRDRRLGARMGEAGRRRWEESFRLGRCIAETQAIYREVLGGSSKGSG
jgi:glycosyltransferase involved in cell wall biosynthesis